MSAYTILHDAIERSRKRRAEAEKELESVTKRGEELKDYMELLDAEIAELVVASEKIAVT